MTRIKVAVRVRPLSNREVGTGSTSIIAVENGNTVAITNMKVPEQNAGDSRERIRRFTFDYCFQENSTQDHVFEAIESVIGQSIKRRFHSCVLAYGQSSSGKTHTMMGFPHDPGLTPKLCHRVFGYLQQTAVGEEALNLKISVSYLEIYNEKVKDLLASEDTDSLKRSPLRIREHPQKGPYVQGLSEHPVADSAGLLEWLEKGNKQRRVAATLTNPESSRSHSVFSISCDGVKLHLIDLAGSERAGSRCYSTPQFREGANINKSLVALGNVISALAELTSKQTKGIRRKFVPYRDSVLTWLLKDTLGGNSNTVMVATVSPSSACYSETVNTLRFGQRAKLIVSHPVVNEDPKEKTIRELRAEIARLRDLLKLSQLPPEVIPQSPMFSSSCSLATDGEEKSKKETRNQDEYNSETETDYKIKEVLIDTSTDNNDVENCKNIVEINTDTKNFNEIWEINSNNLANTNTLPEKTSQIATERLLPLINVSSSIKPVNPTTLKRTYSVDHSYIKMDLGKIKTFASEESIPSTSTFSRKSNSSTSSLEKQNSQDSLASSKPGGSSTPSLRRQSLNKSNPSLPKVPTKRTNQESNLKRSEKATVTDVVNIKKVEPKVNSIRKPSMKPRSQIVAAVTSRLYSKTKKKEVATDTDDINAYKNEMPKELQICSKARSKLRDISRRALKAHRQKHVETQTDLYPVLRVKEIATDVDDLRISLAEVKDAETEAEVISTQDASIDCTLLDRFSEEERKNPGVFFTRSCGTQSSENLTSKDNMNAEKSGISFTKYLREMREPNIEVSNVMPNSPIYTKTVNINISHNYISDHRVDNSISDDSIDEQNLQNVCFPTPDLISNHNSLEQHGQENSGPSKAAPEKSMEAKIRYANSEILQEHFAVNENFTPESERKNSTVASCSVVPKYMEKVDAVNIPKVQAPEICLTKEFDEGFCKPFPVFQPEFAKPNIGEYKGYKCDDCVKLEEPLVLKSIVKQVPKSNKICDHQSSSSDDEIIFCSDVPDSLDYHMTNSKKVKFTGKSNKNQPENQRMIKAMSEFLEEATNLMNNLTMAATNIRSNNIFDDSYELEVTVNDISGFRKPNRKRRKVGRTSSSVDTKQRKNASTHHFSSSFASKVDCSTQCDVDYAIPVNKYEALVEDSCRRLEEKINRTPSRSKVSISQDDYHDDVMDPYPDQIGYNPWDLSQPLNNDVEDSSLESNPVTFSDYGSLPRKTHKRHRTPTCSPSAFLRQLTNMRRQIIESSREELLGGSNNH